MQMQLDSVIKGVEGIQNYLVQEDIFRSAELMLAESEFEQMLLVAKNQI